MKRGMLEGYVSERSERKTVNGKVIEIITYQGDHCDEYLMRDVKSGRCSLFYKGILKLGLQEINGVRKGVLTVYEKGKAFSRGNWKGLDGEEYRYMGNQKNGLELMIERNGVIYRGGFDSVESMKREGRGVEYDEKSGRAVRCGVWKQDELFQVIQEFENEEVMIEYEVEEGKENVSIMNRHPVYEGGYVFDEATSSYLRHGEGCEIEGGIAVREGKWERGKLVESVDLFDGWYVKMEGNDVLDWRMNLRVEIHNLTEGQNVDMRMTELVVPSKCCNESEWSVLDVSALRCLKRITIGDYCFENVNEMKLIGLHKLESVVIGKSSFTKHKNSNDNDPNRHFYLKDCERVKELKMGRYSFSDFSVCEISNLASLEVIAMGEVNIKSCNFKYASLELKNLPKLKSLLFGDRAFCVCSRAVFENLPELTSIQLGSHAFCFKYDDNSSELIMRNLPKLTSLTTDEECSSTFLCPRTITLENIPSLTTVTLNKEYAFKKMKSVNTKNITPAVQYYLSYSVSLSHAFLFRHCAYTSYHMAVDDKERTHSVKKCNPDYPSHDEMQVY